MTHTRPTAGWNIKRATTHPGTILQEEFLTPFGISKNKLAMDIHVPATRIGEIVAGRRAITADTALRLARYFQTSPQFWLNLQQAYDLTTTNNKLAVILKQIGEGVFLVEEAVSQPVSEPATPVRIAQQRRDTGHVPRPRARAVCG